MADPELYEGSADTHGRMQKDLGWISQQLAEAEEAWLIAHHELEAAEEVRLEPAALDRRCLARRFQTC